MTPIMRHKGREGFPKNKSFGGKPELVAFLGR